MLDGYHAIPLDKREDIEEIASITSDTPTYQYPTHYTPDLTLLRQLKNTESPRRVVIIGFVKWF